MAASAADLDAIRALVRAGQHAEALSALEEMLATRPDDTQALFLKGVILAEGERSAEAIRIFTRLAKEFPELPEPHNNLAVLHAAAGDYAKARDALLVAINTHPSYATAHENLGDVYAKMAGLAYDKALQLGAGTSDVRAKLTLIDSLFSTNPAHRSIATVARPEQAAATEAAASASVADPGDEGARRAVLATLVAWATAWSSQDANAYLAFYAPEFVPPRGIARPRWEATRRSRLTRPGFIEVALGDAQVELGGPDRAWVTFVQSYRSNTYRDRVRKRMALSRAGSKWKIIGERTIE